jgi:L,D-peptidoglycan transpeptidase YkuD (ErfK/YbiS/YcfS/YnhG family)
MSIIAVDTATGRLRFGTIDIPCAIGKGGACPADAKHEGDGCTPLGTWPVKGVLLRSSRVAPDAMPALPWRWTRQGDGWSDDPADPAYNRPVHLPHPFSAEQLQREDQAYDVIVILGHNDSPPVPGAGSAIFFHIWVEGRPTEGCVAIAREEMLRILPKLTCDTVMRIG